MKRRALILAFAFAAVASFAQEPPNPFTSTGIKPRSGIALALTTATTGFLARVLTPIQRTLNESLAALTSSLQESRSVSGLLFVLLVSFVYGVFHAAGPGHGKTVVSSYFLANNAKLRHGLIIGYLISAVHAAAALAVVLVLSIVIRGMFTAGIEQANHYIQIVTFAVIAALGAVMLVRRVLGMGHHEHSHGGEGLKDLTFRNLIAVALPAGVIPCPGAVAIMLFALSLNMVGVSILAVVAISLGMGTTISVTGAAVILVKQGGLQALSSGHDARGSLIRKIVEIAGAALLFLFGLVFFLAQL